MERGYTALLVAPFYALSVVLFALGFYLAYTAPTDLHFYSICLTSRAYNSRRLYMVASPSYETFIVSTSDLHLCALGGRCWLDYLHGTYRYRPVESRGEEAHRKRNNLREKNAIQRCFRVPVTRRRAVCNVNRITQQSRSLSARCSHSHSLSYRMCCSIGSS